MNPSAKQRAPRNRTISLSQEELNFYSQNLIRSINKKTNLINKIICGNLLDMLGSLPKNFADLLIIDPPYNLRKNFNGLKFSETDDEGYLEYLETWFPKTIDLLKPNGSIYLCGDWKCSGVLYQIMKKYAVVRNRIIWQREKGRGAKAARYGRPRQKHSRLFGRDVLGKEHG